MEVEAGLDGRHAWHCSTMDTASSWKYVECGLEHTKLCTFSSSMLYTFKVSALTADRT